METVSFPARQILVVFMFTFRLKDRIERENLAAAAASESNDSNVPSIGAPTNVTRVTHIGLTKEGVFEMNNVPPQWASVCTPVCCRHPLPKGFNLISV